MAGEDSMTEDEVLAQSSLMKELVEHPAWKEFEALLGRHIEARKRTVLTPLYDLNMPTVKDPNGNFVFPQTTDAATRQIAVETIKGAIIGLGIATRLPHDIISAASDIRARREAKEKN